MPEYQLPLPPRAVALLELALVRLARERGLELLWLADELATRSADNRIVQGDAE
jgi:hypothetical protein